MSNIDSFKRIAEVEFTEIVKDAFFIDYKIRVTLVDNSFIDVHSHKKYLTNSAFIGNA